MTPLTNALDTVASLAELGGPVVAIIMVISAISLAVILLKIWQFFRMGVGRRARAEKAVALFEEGRPREALALAKEGRSAAARAVALAIHYRTDRRADKAEIEERIARDVTERFFDQPDSIKAKVTRPGIWNATRSASSPYPTTTPWSSPCPASPSPARPTK